MVRPERSSSKAGDAVQIPAPARVGMMAAHKKKRKPVRSESKAFGALLLRSLRGYVRALPAIAVVGLAGAIPMQLVVTWLMVHQGIAGDLIWEWRYQGLADGILGCVISAALYLTIHRCLVQGPPSLVGLPRVLGWAYRRAVGVWLGMFMTRMMVSFVIALPALPLLGGLYLITRRWPEFSQVITHPGSASPNPATLLPFLILVPLLALPLFYYLRYALIEAVVSLERTDGFEALRRSQTLTDGAGQGRGPGACG